MGTQATKLLSEEQQDFCSGLATKGLVIVGEMGNPLTDAASAAQWLRTERANRGWSAEEVARRARSYAREDGSQIALSQQSISNFESGKAKRVPEWLRYVRRAFEEHSLEAEAGATGAIRNLIRMKADGREPAPDELAAVAQALGAAPGSNVEVEPQIRVGRQVLLPDLLITAPDGSKTVVEWKSSEMLEAAIEQAFVYAQAIGAANVIVVTPTRMVKLRTPAGAREAVPVVEAPVPPTLQRDVPVLGTALGADLEFTSLDGHPVAIEQTMLNQAETVDHVRRLPALQDERDAYAVYVQGSSMSPAYEDGDPALVTPGRHPRPGDYVVVQLVRPDGDGEEYASALIKRLIRRSGSYVELEQFNPPAKFKVEASRVKAVHRVMRWAEASGL